jgi:hypothetical protein
MVEMFNCRTPVESRKSGPKQGKRSAEVADEKVAKFGSCANLPQLEPTAMYALTVAFKTAVSAVLDPWRFVDFQTVVAK